VPVGAVEVAASYTLRRTERVGYAGPPAVVFTHPQLASAGLTEAQVLAQGIRCACRLLNLTDVPGRWPTEIPAAP